MPDGDLMLHHVTLGFLANGEDAGPAQDDTLPTLANLSLRMLTIAAFDLSARILEDLERDQPPVMLTVYLRKLLRFVVKGGTTLSNPSFLTRVAHTADYLHDRPHLIMTKAGFAALSQLALDHQAFTRRQLEPKRRHEQDIEEMRLKVHPPPAFIRWQSDDGKYALLEAAHPFHVWELGIVYGNCLSRVNPYDSRSRVKPKDSTQLPQLEYWLAISGGAYDLYSLRQGTTVVCILGLLQGCIIEFAVRHPDEPNLWELLADTTQYIEVRYGEVRHDLSRRIDPHQHFLARVNEARKRRGLKSMRHDWTVRTSSFLRGDPRHIIPMRFG